MGYTGWKSGARTYFSKTNFPYAQASSNDCYSASISLQCAWLPKFPIARYGQFPKGSLDDSIPLFPQTLSLARPILYQINELRLYVTASLNTDLQRMIILYLFLFFISPSRRCESQGSIYPPIALTYIIVKYDRMTRNFQAEDFASIRSLWPETASCRGVILPPL